MNSLNYLSRQFDVLAAARTPPSTPSQESVHLLPDTSQDGSPLKRVQTWSTKSILFSSHPPLPSSSLKRSYSSPGDVFPQPTASSSSTSSRPPSSSPSRRRSIPSSKRPAVSPSPPRRSSVSSQDKTTHTKSRSKRLTNLFRRIFLLNVLLSLCNYLIALWRSLMRLPFLSSLHRVGPEIIVATPIEDSTDEEGKDSEEDETKEQDNNTVSIVPHSIPIDTSLPPSSQAPTLDINPVTRADVISIPPHSQPELSFVLDSTPSPSSLVLSSPYPSPSSRTPTPTPGEPKSTLIKTLRQKTLVLDLDETLIHSTSSKMYNSSGGILSSFGIGRRNKGVGHTVEVVLGGRSTLYHVYKRPFVDYFLRKVSAWYTLVIFTASMQEYADPVIDWLDAGRGIIHGRFFRESCTQLPNGAYTKDLSVVNPDLSLVCLVDNSPVCYTINEANGIPIEGWTHDPHDEALLDLLPVLDSLRFTQDVRSVLGIRGFS